MEIKGIRKAVRLYLEANEGGYYSPRYGMLMLDRSTGEVWCDEFNDLGHNSYVNYKDPAVINLAREIYSSGDEVTTTTATLYASKLCENWSSLIQEVTP